MFNREILVIVNQAFRGFKTFSLYLNTVFTYPFVLSQKYWSMSIIAVK